MRTLVRRGNAKDDLEFQAGSLESNL